MKNGYNIYELRIQKTPKTHVLKLKLTIKLDLRLGGRLLHYQTLTFITLGKT